MVRPARQCARDTLAFDPASPEVVALVAADEDLAHLIEEVGEVVVDIEGDGFVSLARAICDQQISIHAARAIWGRLEVLCGSLGIAAPPRRCGKSGLPVAGGTSTSSAITAEEIAALDIEQLRSVGLSRAKASYLHDLSAHVIDGRIDFEALALLDDEAIIAELMHIKGVGRWTAQMHLVFALGRLDVFTPADGGLRRSVALLKGLPTDAPPQLIEALAEEWAPYRTVASLYLWRGLGQGVLQSL
jgi:DNA-3-methyladenine glycosylase II